MSETKTTEYQGKVVAVTGGGGVLCGGFARALGGCGATIAVLDLNLDAAEAVASEIRSAGGKAKAFRVDVLSRESVQNTAQDIVAEFGRVDALINGAGGNKAQATTSNELSFFDLPADAIRWVFDLNLMGTIIPSQIFGKLMADQDSGAIINISSMAADRPLTRTLAYSAAKAGVSNFTQWLAVHMAQEYSANIRVNAIAPGFFLTEQNRYLLTDQSTGDLTERGRLIINHTPQGRFGTPEDLVGAVLWLLSDSASFVHGAVIPVDGGFSAYAGV